MGWARIVRSGAVTTPQQEHFLVSLKGRADVRRYARLPVHPDDEKVAPCCTLQ